ncbi:MAG: hypothetical protein RL300_696 [Pseudomonadota bacterium]
MFPARHVALGTGDILMFATEPIIGLRMIE